MIGMLALACGAMAVKDALGTWLVIAEARGRDWLAGTLDALGDLAQVFVYAVGAGAVIVHGWTVQSLATIAAMMVTSFWGTVLWTRIGRRIATVETSKTV